VNPYDYEKIVFVLQQLAGAEATQLETKAEQGLQLLDCLKHYSRVAPPLEFEKQWFVNHYSTSSNATQEVTLPEASEMRLPFHPLLYSTPLSIIGPELSIETVGKLTPIAKILHVRGIGEMCNCIIIWTTFCRECVSAGVSIPSPSRSSQTMISTLRPLRISSSLRHALEVWPLVPADFHFLK